MRFLHIHSYKISFNSKFCNRYDEWEIDIDQVELVEKIGKGAFGEVWKAKIDSSILAETSPKTSSKPKRKKERRRNLTVAVKMLHG